MKIGGPSLCLASFCFACLIAISFSVQPAVPQDQSAAQPDRQKEDSPIVIAHRGASGYLPEHTLAAVAMAHAQGADFIEQDVVLSRDGVPLVLHDIHLDTVTDVALKFPERKRDDGRFYAIDFDLKEIRQLSVHERKQHGRDEAAFPDRFPTEYRLLRVPTLEDEIQLIAGLNKSTGRHVGLYVEIKAPAWHKEQGQDISKRTLDLLARHGFDHRDSNCYVQCFDARELRRIREELSCKLRLIQLMGSNAWNESDTDFDELTSRQGLQQVAEYADGIGPWMPQVVAPVNTRDPASADASTPRAENEDLPGYRVTGLVAAAHELGLAVHPFTFRSDALPSYAQDYDQLVSIFIAEARIDGMFTDFPDKTIHIRDNVHQATK